MSCGGGHLWYYCSNAYILSLCWQFGRRFFMDRCLRNQSLKPILTVLLVPSADGPVGHLIFLGTKEAGIQIWIQQWADGLKPFCGNILRCFCLTHLQAPFFHLKRATILRARTTGELRTRKELNGAEQRRDNGRPVPIRLAKICQQGCAKQRKGMCLNGTEQCLDMRRRLPVFCQPAPHGGFICLAGVQGPAIYNILYDRRCVMFVGSDEMRQFRMGMPTMRANPNGYAADFYWQATLQGLPSFLQRGFFRAFLSVYSSLIIYRQKRHGKRAEQPQYGQRLRAINGILA